MKIQCPSCKRVFWETTETYDPDIRPNGSMVRLIEPYKSNHWPVFGDGVMVSSAATLAAEMDCPACLAQLAPSGKLTIYKEPDVIKEPVVEVIPEPEKELDKKIDKKPALKTLFTGKKGKK